MYQSLLQNASLYYLLIEIDAGLAAEAREGGCECGGVLHRADYERKPRGGPVGLSREHATRYSFCCARDGCRKRKQPQSLRFLGRRVFFGVLVLLVPVLLDGPTPVRMSRLREVLAVSVRTVRRWRRFWREAFARSRVWLAARGRLAIPVIPESLPGSLLDAFSNLAEVQERVIAVLHLVSTPDGEPAL